MKKRDTIIFPDQHADLESSKEALVQAGLARREGRTFILNDVKHPAINGCRIIYQGDYINRGPKSLGVIGLMMDLTEHFHRHVTLLLGNHEVAALQSTSCPKEPKWQGRYMEGLHVYAEIAAHKKLAPLPKPTMDAHPLRDFHPHLDPDDPHSTYYFKEWKKAISQHPEWHTVDFPNALGLTRDLFFDGGLRVFFEQLKVAHRTEGILHVHAGMNEAGIEEDIDGLNELYAKSFREKNLARLDDFDWSKMKGEDPLAELFCMLRPLPVSGQLPSPLLSPQTTIMMQNAGYGMLLHGHAAISNRIPPRGIQKLYIDHGRIAVLNNDVVTSKDHPAYSGSYYGFVLYDRESGEVKVVNPKTGPTVVGRMQKKGEEKWVFERAADERKGRSRIFMGGN